MSEPSTLFEQVKEPFLAAPDGMTLSRLIEQHPFMLEPDFLETVARWQAEAEAKQEWDRANGLRERLEVLRELADQGLPEIQLTLTAFAAVQSPAEMADLAERMPMVLDPGFHDIVAQLIEHAKQAGDHDDAHALQMRLDDARALMSRQSHENQERLMQTLLDLPDQQALLELTQRVPELLEQDFIDELERRTEAAEAEGKHELWGRMRARWEGLRHLRAQVQIALPQTLEAFAATRDPGEILALAQRAPFILEDRFIAAVEHAISELQQAGAVQDAEGLIVRLQALRYLAEQRTMADQSPLMQALISFLNAAHEQEARVVFEEQRQLLDNDEAEQTLADTFAGGDPDSQQRIEERQQLLRSLRSAS